MILIRKYFLVFFAVLMVFIWIGHKNTKNKRDVDDSYFDYEVTSVTPTKSAWVRSSSLARQHHLQVLIRNELHGKLGEMKAKFTEKDKANLDYPDEQAQEAIRLRPSRFFVKSNSCKMPDVDPFSRKAKQLLKTAKLPACSNATDLFQLHFDTNTKQYQLEVDTKVLSELNRPVLNIDCNYLKINSGNPQHNNNRKTPVYFKQRCMLPRHLSAVLVECHAAHNTSMILQRDAFSLLQESKLPKWKETRSTQKRQPSVVILGLGSMSRMSFRRSMPKAAKLVSQEGWVEMEGYNKVGENTYHNLAPVLSGFSLGQLNRMCQILDNRCSDRVPWIWKEFKSAGYVTAFADDGLSNQTALQFPGFSDDDMDYYQRPLLISIARTLSLFKKVGQDYCVGRRLTVAYVLDFCSQFTLQFIRKQGRPTFGFFWTSTLNSSSTLLEETFMKYMHQFQQQHLFEESIVILMSDQGARFGELLDLPSSFLEERLPMLHIYLPPWFRAAYPQHAQALALNRNRLSSNFDLHRTLKHLLRLNAHSRGKLSLASSCPTSQSLLFPLPEERSCQKACIGEHWCTCDEFISQKLTPDIYLIGKHVLYYINHWMILNGFNKYCQHLGLEDLEYAEQKLRNDKNDKEAIYDNVVTYRLCLRTYPNDAKYQMTVRYNLELNTFDGLNVPDISRLNGDSSQASCVQDEIAKKFCLCYPKEKLNESMREWKNLALTTVPAF